MSWAVPDVLLNVSVQYIDDALPPESPYLYGLHPNAEIGFLTQRSERLLHTVLELQPRDSSTGQGALGTREEMVRVLRAMGTQEGMVRVLRAMGTQEGMVGVLRGMGTQEGMVRVLRGSCRGSVSVSSISSV